ncbi:MAG TPA: glycine--tRNA ligase subunit beta [Vicinamibacterales bacterium]|jgi:glycyl-tRNA synthetase beta chain|nr:glycine--tRNA ligase subunit beta [Vicinamibacterales bacterium]
MDRELLLEIGCEELPAGWLPRLTTQIGEIVESELRGNRLIPEAPAETFSTPRRLTVRIARVPERQTDLEELVNGPPVSASFNAAGEPTPAAAGFAAKQGVDVRTLERVQTSKGEYLAFRKRQRGRAAVDVLPEVLGASLRRMTFPKLMRWDATLEDGRGELLFGRPIRWMLFIYGGRVVPFTITRAPQAQNGQVQDVPTGAVTYGHRFLTTSGRAGRAIKVRSFEEYHARLLENFVILERGERHDKIARELDAKAQRLQGRVSRATHNDSGLLQEVPDLVEYPSVVAGIFAPEFLELPEDVLTTTLVHHQHYFPVETEDGRLKNAFLAVINTEPDNERTIARNAERVVSARLRDARFFWDADRKVALEARVDRLVTLVFHKQVGTYKQKAERIERLAEWIGREAFGVGEDIAQMARTAARLAKADLTTEMVREFTELQGRMGGIYAREEGLPEEIWKAIYFHYLPHGVEADAPPTRAQLGRASTTWAAVALADKLDTLVGLFAAGEKPTGSRDPFGLRRAAQGAMKILADLPSLTGINKRIGVGELVRQSAIQCGQESRLGGRASGNDDWAARLSDFLTERMRYLVEQRGAKYDEVNAVADPHGALESLVPSTVVAKAKAIAEARRLPDFEAIAELFKRVKNISKNVEFTIGWPALIDYADQQSQEAAEKALIHQVAKHADSIRHAEAQADYLGALTRIAKFQPFVAHYFDEVLVMDPNEAVRDTRLQLMAGLKALVLTIADISEIAPKDAPG